MARPVLKWAGGKTKLLPELMKRLPADYYQRRHVELFAGGAALFFHARDRSHNQKYRMAGSMGDVLVDVNADLILAYHELAQNYCTVLEHLRKFEELHCRDFYFDLRTHFNGPFGKEDLTHRAAVFIYLNKTCFNGLWRVDREGRFNVSIGTTKKFVDEELLSAGRRMLSLTTVLSFDVVRVPFVKWPMRLLASDFVYLDPPYDPMTETDFTNYAGGFEWDAQVRLHDLCRKLHRGGVKFLLSNNATPRILEMYKKFRCEMVLAPRSIACNGSRAKVLEVLIRNYEACLGECSS